MNYKPLYLMDLEWLERVIKVRLEYPKVDIGNFSLANVNGHSTFSGREKEEYEVAMIDASLYENSSYRNLVLDLPMEERLLLILSLSTHMETGFIDRIINKPHFLELIDKSPNFYYAAGLVSKSNYGLLPTGRFWMYLIAGNDNSKRISLIQSVLNKQIYLIDQKVVSFTEVEEYEPLFGGLIKINSDVLTKLLS